jgi:hypothetical protein
LTFLSVVDSSALPIFERILSFFERKSKSKTKNSRIDFFQKVIEDGNQTSFSNHVRKEEEKQLPPTYFYGGREPCQGFKHGSLKKGVI